MTTNEEPEPTLEEQDEQPHQIEPISSQSGGLEGSRIDPGFLFFNKQASDYLNN